MSADLPPWSDATLLIHGLPEPDQFGAHLPPIYQTTTFALPSVEAVRRILSGAEPGYAYSRASNPTLAQLERTLAALEHAAGCITYASGMGAVSAAFMAALKAGDRIVIQDVHYGSSQSFCATILPQIGVEVATADFADLAAVERVVSERPTALVFLETPANPTLKLCDIQAISEIAHRHGAAVAIDATFASPLLTRPLELGADLVVHATTKHFGGYGAALGGAVLFRDHARWQPPLFHLRTMFGAVPSPFDSWLIQIGLKTLHLRFERALTNAWTIAQWLRARPEVAAVHYPQFADHPQHDICQRQMRGRGGTIVSFDLAGGAQAAETLLANLKLFALTFSLGYVDSLAQYPAAMTHGMLPPEQRHAMGIGDGLVRLSVGTEEIGDLLADLEHGLGRIGG